jgi:hypothetical protein
MKPISRDDNGHPIPDRGTELFTTRITDLGTTLSEVVLPTDFKEILFHVESGSEVLLVRGTVPGSETARITDAGYTWVVPLTVESDSPIAHISAPSGTCNVSIFAWR